MSMRDKIVAMNAKITELRSEAKTLAIQLGDLNEEDNFDLDRAGFCLKEGHLEGAKECLDDWLKELDGQADKDDSGIEGDLDDYGEPEDE